MNQPDDYVEIQVNVRRTYLSLLIRCPDAEEVSRLLNIHPDKISKHKGKNPSFTWKLTSKGKVHSIDLPEHLDWLLNQLYSSNAQSGLRQLQAQNCRTYVSCYWLARGDNTGIILEPSTMRKLADFGLTIEFDIYL